VEIMEKFKGSNQVYDTLKNRLVRSQVERQKHTGEVLPIFDALTSADPTPIGRSEYFASPEAIKDAVVKMGVLRDFLFSNGRPMKSHPEYQEQMDDTGRSPEQYENYYWRRDGNNYIGADKVPFSSKNDKPEFLTIIMETDEKEVYFEQGYDGTYSLVVNYLNVSEAPSEKPVRHNSHDPVETPENEVEIIHDTLDRYIAVMGMFTQGQQN